MGRSVVKVLTNICIALGVQTELPHIILNYEERVICLNRCGNCRAEG